jgi:hypothetical protein
MTGAGTLLQTAYTNQDIEHVSQNNTNCMTLHTHVLHEHVVELERLHVLKLCS